MALDEIIKLVGAVGIGAIVTTIGTFIQSSKKNQLDYITKERSEWRKHLKEIIKKLNNPTDREDAIEELRSQINPYGKDIDIKNTKYYFMKDGHIWDTLNMWREDDYKKVIFFVELLLKYDWERSKKEIAIKPYEFIHEAIRFILLIFSFGNVYFVVKSSSLDNIGVALSSLVVILLIIQKMATGAAISNPSKSNNEKIWIFIFLYAVPYGYIINSLVDILKFSEPTAIKSILAMGLFVYEFYYLSLFDSCEDMYVKEIERYLNPKSKQYKKGISLTNQIRDREEKLYQYEYDISTINAMNKRLKKIKKKLTKKKRPRDYWRHPFLFCEYRKNRKRIIKVVKNIRRTPHVKRTFTKIQSSRG